MTWTYYGLDREAQKLVLEAKKRDKKENDDNKKSIKESHKMRQAVVYGLERFWGEHLRLKEREKVKSKYWKDTWDTLVQIMKKAGITIPNDEINNTDSIENMAKKLWGELAVDEENTKLTNEDCRIALAVLTQLCDSMVWWTQRYK